MKPFLDLHSTLHCQQKKYPWLELELRAIDELWRVCYISYKQDWRAIAGAAIHSSYHILHAISLANKIEYINFQVPSIRLVRPPKKRGGRHGQWLCYLFIFLFAFSYVFFFYFLMEEVGFRGSENHESHGRRGCCTVFIHVFALVRLIAAIT